jgi:hypothetical protein
MPNPAVDWRLGVLAQQEWLPRAFFDRLAASAASTYVNLIEVRQFPSGHSPAK